MVRSAFFLSLAPLLALALVAPAVAADAGQEQLDRSERDDIIDVRADDPEMTAAIAGARAELPDFLRRLANPRDGEAEFSIKFNLADTGEMIWAGTLTLENGRLSGLLSNVPMHPDFRQGQRVDIPDSAIIDWGYVRDDRFEGNHTTRVLIDRMPPEQAAQYRAALGW